MSIPENAEQLYGYLTGHGLTPTAAAGILGNIGQESGGNPYAGAWPSNYGLIQWTPASSYFSAPPTFAEQEAGIITYIDANGGIQRINAAATSPAAAALYFSEEYERPAAWAANNANREAIAQAVATAARSGQWATSTGSRTVRAGGTSTTAGQTVSTAGGTLTAGTGTPTGGTTTTAGPTGLGGFFSALLNLEENASGYAMRVGEIIAGTLALSVGIVLIAAVLARRERQVTAGYRRARRALTARPSAGQPARAVTRGQSAVDERGVATRPFRSPRPRGRYGAYGRPPRDTEAEEEGHWIEGERLYDRMRRAGVPDEEMERVFDLDYEDRPGAAREAIREARTPEARTRRVMHRPGEGPRPGEEPF